VIVKFFYENIGDFFCSINLEHFRMKKSPKLANDFYCECCNYKCSKESDYEKHLLTSKHKKHTKLNDLEQNLAKTRQYICDNCNKTYTARNSLWYHKQKCIIQHENITEPTYEPGEELVITKDIFMMVVNQNKELLEIIKNGTNSISNNINNNNSNNTNSHNKTFNLQFFLNETCKNAMNIDEFVSSIQPTFEDLEHVGKVGYVEGISSIIIKKLNEVGVTERPFHCSDLKREVLYIKTNNAWSKETEEKPLLVNAIKQIAKLNMDNILPWQQAHPGCTKSDSIFNKKYLNMVMHSMNGDESFKNINKIMTKLSNATQLTNIKQ
jgi:hypothetical protein